MKKSWVSEALEILETLKEVQEKLKKMKAFLHSEFEKKCSARNRVCARARVCVKKNDHFCSNIIIK